MTCGDKFNKNCPTGGTSVTSEEADGRPLCDHPGCGKRLRGDGSCVDGHVQGHGAGAACPPGEAASATGGQGKGTGVGPADEVARIPLDVLHSLQNGLESRYPGLDLWFSQSPGGHLVVDRIVVPKEQRGKGIGAAVMREIVATADAHGVPMAVTPDNAFGGSVTRLRRFYRRFGFVPNQGRHKDFTTREAMVRPAQPHAAAGQPAAPALPVAEARCAYPGCGKRITTHGRCADGHDQATAGQAPQPIPLPECHVPKDEEGEVVDVAGVYAPLIAVARECGVVFSKMIAGNGRDIALALNDRAGSYWATYLRFDPRTKRLYSGGGWSVRDQWYQARRDMGQALRATAADQKEAGRALIAAVQKFREADEWPYEELVALPGGEMGWPEPRRDSGMGAGEPTTAAGAALEERDDSKGAERGEPDARCAVCGTAIYPDEGRGQCIICGATMCGHCTISGARCRDCDTAGWYDT